MSTFPMAALAGMNMFALLVAAIVGSLLGALVLSVAFRLVVGHMPSYLRALGAVVVTWVGSLLALLALRAALPAGAGGLAGAVVLFLVGTAVVARLLPTETGLPIGYGKAGLVQLAYMGMGFVLALVFGMLMALMFGSVLAGLH